MIDVFFLKTLSAEDLSTNIAKEKQIVDRLWDILLQSPRRGTTFDRVYRFYVDSGHGNLLVDRCRTLIEEHQDRSKVAGAWLLLGLFMERRGEWNQAAEAFEKAAELDVQNAVAPFYLAEIRIRQGKLEEASGDLQESLRRKPGRADIRGIMQRLVNVAERLGNPQKLKEVRLQFEQLFPDDLDIRQQIAETLQTEGRLDDALRQYEELIQKSPKNSYDRIRFSLSAADIKIRLGQKEQALDDYNTLLDGLAPESWPAETVRHRIERLFNQNDDDNGLAEFYRKRLEKHPGELESVCRLALVLQRLKQNAEAEKLLEEKIKSFPSNIPLRESFASLLVDENRIGEALEQYAELNRLEPGSADRIVPWGRLALSNSDWNEEQRKKEAFGIWYRLVEKHPDDPQTICHVADLAAQYEMPEQAERLYCRAIELRPNQIEYREYLGLFYHRQQKKDQAVEILRSMAQGPRQNIENLIYSASILQSLGYAEDALRQFELTVGFASNDPQIRWKYAEALILNGNCEQFFDQLIKIQTLIDGDEQFSAFLDREVRLLRNLQTGKNKPLDRLAELLEKQIKPLSQSLSKRQQVRLFWRLAAYHIEQGKTEAAIQAINRAISMESPSLPLLQTAAELFERCGRKVEAIELYRKLLAVDGVWQVGYLKHLATLLFENGEADEAVKMGHRLMELGSGNVANIRFFAELLTKLGRRGEAIDCLRQALRVEPGDTETLKLLAENLAKTGNKHEAAEIVWRIFERKETIAGKLNAVPMLVESFQKAGLFDLLINRFQNNRLNYKNRRETALCLAAVYSVIADWSKARSLLENELISTADFEADDLLFLKSLVEITEKQNDFSSAVKYQEMICRKHRSLDALDKLFILYDKNGDHKKAVDLFLGSILLKNDLRDQVESIDRMIRREEYDAVDRVLSFLEIHDAVNWEIPYRRIALVCYRQEGDVAELVKEFRNLFFLENQTENRANRISSKIQSNDSQTELQTNPWILPDWKESDDSFPDAEFLLTLFRDRLQRNEHYQTPNKVAPPKPFLAPQSLQDARFFALGWKLKEALDLDFAENSKNFGNGTLTLAKHQTKYDNFDKTARQIRNELSDDSPERKRFEQFVDAIRQILENQPEP